MPPPDTSFKGRPWDVAAGVDCGVDAFGVHPFQQLCAENTVQQRFATRDCDAPAIGVENPVLQQLFSRFIHRDGFAEKLQHARGTCVNAFATCFAVGTLELMHAVDDCVAGADLCALAAAGAFRVVDTCGNAQAESL